MSIAETAKSFYEIEKKVQKMCHELGCELIKAVLEGWDAELEQSREHGVYRHKGKRKRVIKTVMGEVEYKRTVYETQTGDGTRSCVYLLDEAMGMQGSGFMSGLLSEQIVQASCESSYRSAARAVSEMTGQTISHTTAWSVVQSLGERIDTQEQEAAKLAQDSKGEGKLERKLLFEEQDGIWLKLQGKARKQYGTSREMKLAIAYDGAKKTGQKRYELTNKVACANFETAEQFQKRKEGAIAAVYNIDEIATRFLNGDGAQWIKQAVTDETVHFQMDPFHRNKAIRQWVKNPDMQKELFRLLYAKDIDMLLKFIEALSNSVEDEEEEENLLALLTYFTNNRDGLIPFHRRGLDLPAPPDGMVYRRLGTMESNVFTILGNRMKGRRACWSINGANNLARLLCLKATKKLSGTLQSLSALVLPEKYAEEIRILTPARVAKSVGTGYAGFAKSAAVPATPEYKWLRGLGAFRTLNDI